MKMTDDWGIPDNYFGRSPDEFYAGIGRVVSVAALMELHLLYLVWCLDRTKTQDVHAGKPGRELIKLCRSCLEDLNDGLRADVDQLMDEIEPALEARHTIVHNVWPSPGAERAYGWRPVTRQKRRPDGGGWIVDGQVSPEDMRVLTARLVDLTERLIRTRQLAEADAMRAYLARGANQGS